MNELVREFKNHMRDLFMKLHYPNEGEYFGQVHISRREKGQEKVLPYRRFKADTVAKDVATLPDDECDYYITANAFVKWQRLSENIYTLNNIVIDCDVHSVQGALPYPKADLIVDAVLQNDELERPNSVIYTGRGVQLWWAIDPLSYKWIAAYEKIRDKIICSVEESVSSLPFDVNVDKIASRNAAGLFRLPGSYNTKSGTWGIIDILHTDRINIVEKLQELQKRETRKHKMPKVPFGGLRSMGSAAGREASLVSLIRLRNAPAGNENRDLFLFIDYCIWAEIIHEHDDIMAHLLKMNALFKEPMPASEVEAYMQSAKTKRYKITNAKIIDKLGITSQEQVLIGMYPNKREAERSANREKKEETRKRIIALSEQGHTQVEICEKVGCSRSKVAAVLKPQKTAADDRKWKALSLYEQGLTLEMIAKQLKVSRRTVYRYIAS